MNVAAILKAILEFIAGLFSTKEIERNVVVEVRPVDPPPIDPDRVDELLALDARMRKQLQSEDRPASGDENGGDPSRDAGPDTGTDLSQVTTRRIRRGNDD